MPKVPLFKTQVELVFGSCVIAGLAFFIIAISAIGWLPLGSDEVVDPSAAGMLLLHDIMLLAQAAIAGIVAIVMFGHGKKRADKHITDPAIRTSVVADLKENLTNSVVVGVAAFLVYLAFFLPGYSESLSFIYKKYLLGDILQWLIYMGTLGYAWFTMELTRFQEIQTPPE